jgi:hypothetical protein
VAIVAFAMFAIAIGIAIAIDGFFGSTFFDTDCDSDSDEEPLEWFSLAVRYPHAPFR